MVDLDVINSALANQNLSSTEAAQRQASNEAIEEASELTQEDFLTLMITQLQNQDPFDPVDPTEYVSQLAQYSSVSGISEMNDQISELTSSLRGNQVLEGASLIGHTIIAPGSEIYLAESDGETARGATAIVDVPEGASSVQLQVKDSTGQLVSTQSLDTTAGLQAFSWDGTKSDGSEAAAGTYTFEVVAKVGDENVSLETSVAATVASVALDPSTGTLMLDTDPLGEVAMSDVERVL